uniref:Transcription factor CBF/NF-Y/archaeal histone domain-containing protein n=1 Tax=Ananas comosus var. bracteatus TaxID=296719 RepID=A0A6V7QRW9_ANACO
MLRMVGALVVGNGNHSGANIVHNYPMSLLVLCMVLASLVVIAMAIFACGDDASSEGSGKRHGVNPAADFNGATGPSSGDRRRNSGGLPRGRRGRALPSVPPPLPAAAAAAAAATAAAAAFLGGSVPRDRADHRFQEPQPPLARIKKIMKADEDVRMIAAEAPVVFARACEMFILELTHRGWAHAEENKRRTLQKSDIAAAIARTDVFDFLVDIVPREEGKDDSIPRPIGAPAADPLTYYYVQQPPPRKCESSYHLRCACPCLCSLHVMVSP